MLTVGLLQGSLVMTLELVVAQVVHPVTAMTPLLAAAVEHRALAVQPELLMVLLGRSIRALAGEKVEVMELLRTTAEQMTVEMVVHSRMAVDQTKSQAAAAVVVDTTAVVAAASVTHAITVVLAAAAALATQQAHQQLMQVVAAKTQVITMTLTAAVWVMVV